MPCPGDGLEAGFDRNQSCRPVVLPLPKRVAAPVEQVSRIVASLSGLFQRDARIDAERQPLFLAGTAVFEAPVLRSTRQDLQIEAAAIGKSHAFPGRWTGGVPALRIGERHSSHLA